MRSIKVTPNDDRNFAFVSGTEAICHSNKCLQLRSTLVASDKLQEFSCHHIKADLSEPVYFINFTSEEIKSFTPDQNVHTEIENMQDENFNFKNCLWSVYKTEII